MMRIGSKKLCERYGMRKLTLNLCVLFLAFCFVTQAWAASDDVPAGTKQLPNVSNYVAPQLPPIPEYVKAWPKQVAVEKPDPVLGDKPYWESSRTGSSGSTVKPLPSASRGFRSKGLILNSRAGSMRWLPGYSNSIFGAA